MEFFLSLLQMFQLMYFILAPLIDVVALAKGRNSSHIQVRDIYFAAIAFPFGVVSEVDDAHEKIGFVQKFEIKEK